uniref:SAM-dependent methyltransferase n=2 Tax=Pseudomonadota TaxID=1224 RepID=UPI0039B5F40A
MGRVVLIGAGPGAEDLITVRGLKLLMQADCVFYDALVSPSLLSEARSDAKLVA